MSENTKIEWADHTFNPWVGCTKISPACDICYAEAWAKRAGKAIGVTWGGERRRTSADNWGKPIKWNSRAESEVRRYRVFCSSLADVFDNQVPREWRDDLFTLIEQTPSLDWLLLTKRIGNVGNMLPVPFDFDRLYPNVWIGSTICNQAEADRDIPKLLAVPAAKRFLSIEPMLGPIDLSFALQPWPINGPEYGRMLDWVIAGGESGPRARPMHPDWARSLRDQCAAAGVPFMFKQWGEWCPRGPESLGYPSVDGVPRFRMTDAGHDGQDLGSDGGNDVWMNRAGKKRAGRLLDGVQHDGAPD